MTTQTLKFTGIWIPTEILMHSELTLTAKVLYGLLDGLDGDDGCWASNRYLEERLGVKERAIQSALKELTDLGLVVRDTGPSDSKRVLHTVERAALRMTLQDPPQKNAGHPAEKCGVPPQKNAPLYKRDKKEDKTPPTPSMGNEGSSKSKPYAVPDVLLYPDLPFKEPEFKQAWDEFSLHRKNVMEQRAEAKGSRPDKVRHKLTPEATRLLFKDFRSWGLAKTVASIRESIKRDYVSVFPVRDGFQPKAQGQTNSSADHKDFFGA